MAYRFRVRGAGHFTAEQTRSGNAFIHAGRRVTIDGEGFQLNWNGPEVVQAIEEAIVSALSELADDALTYMQSIVPVKTGALRDSCFAQITVENGRLVLSIGATAPYAVYVELGSIRNAAQPYIRPTFDLIKSKLPDLIRKEVASRGRS